ncbi:MAG: hypothetical protein SVY10_19830 [Thermodesulfobacteriota bacterium]|nr:hypothetical protein [Thermodesulfobacteriota bacterium]
MARITVEIEDSKYGFRPQRNAHQAVRHEQKYLRGGCTWVEDIA